MASQYFVKANPDGGYDLYMRDLVSHGEYRARFDHMTNDCGMTPEEVAIELYHMVAAFKKQNPKPASLVLCERYIFDTMDPGDIISIGDDHWVVNRPGRA